MRKDSQRNVGLVRVLSMLRLLQGYERHTINALAERFSVTTRTIRRDLDVLQRVGYPIAHEERGDGGNGNWWLVQR